MTLKYILAFTLIEFLLVVGIIVILAALVILAINPQKQLADMRNAKRESDIRTIMDAVYQNSIDNKGTLLDEITEEWKIVSPSSADNCNIPCGSSGEENSTAFSNENSSEFNLGSYSDTFFNGTSNFLELNSQGITAGSGNYYSEVKDMGISSTLTSLSWIATDYLEELPDNGDPGEVSMQENVLLLHLEETSGTSITDSSGSNNNGTLQAPDKYSLGEPGRFNKAIRFMNSSQTDGGQIIIPHSTSLSLGEEGTVCAWVNLTDTSQDWGGIVHKGIRSDFRDEEYSLQLYYGNRATFNVTDTNGNYKLVIGNTPLQPNQWYNLCGTYKRGDATKIYVNGVLDGTSNWEQTIIPVTNIDSSVQVGSQLVGTNKYGFKGLIDEVSIFKKSLPEEEIETIHEYGATRINFQVRACDNPDCSDSAFKGPDNTADTFFTKDDAQANPLSGTTNLTGRYWQYRTFMETSLPQSPELSKVLLSGYANFETTANSCANLGSLAPDYLVSIPSDDSPGNGLTNYAIRKTSGGRIDIRACNGENGKTIELKR